MFANGSSGRIAERIAGRVAGRIAERIAEHIAGRITGRPPLSFRDKSVIVCLWLFVNIW